MSATIQKEDNVIQLTPPLSKKQLYNAQHSIEFAVEQKKLFCNETLDFTFEHTVNCMKQFGFFQDKSRVSDKDMILLEQTLEAIMYRYYGIEHPMHEVIEELVSFPNDEAEESETESE